MAVPIYEVYNTGTTTYVGFTFLDYYGVTKTIDILGLSSRYYYLNCDALTPPTSPSPDIILSIWDNMTGDMYTFSSCCNSQIFGIMGAPNFPASDGIGNSYYFEEVITSSNPNEFFDANCYEWIDVNDSLSLNPTMCTVWSNVGKYIDCAGCLLSYSCCPTISCISNTGIPLYNDNYEDTYLNYDGQHYYTGQTNGLVIYYSSGDTQWCLSDTLGGTCFLSGKSPCSTSCPDLCDELFTSGTCPTPTPTPTNNCGSLDFAVLFDCDLPPTPSVTPTSTVTPTVTVTPTSTNICPVSFIDATIFSLSPTPTRTPTPTPTPSRNVERDCTFSGVVSFDMINDEIICPFSNEFQDCFYDGVKYFTYDSIENPQGGNILQFQIFKALVNGQSRCIHYVGINTNPQEISSITLLSAGYGFSNQGQCNNCNNVNTPTPTSTPTVTPTISLTPSNTPPVTQTPSITPTQTQPIVCVCYTVEWVLPDAEFWYGVTNFSYRDCDGTIIYTSVTEFGGPKNICARLNSIRINTSTNNDESLVAYESLENCCFDFSCVSGQLIIDNNSSGSSIDEIYSTPNNWIIASSVPVGPSGIDTGAQGGTNNPISIEIGDFSSLDNPSCLLMYVNSVLIESKNVTSSGTYTFNPYSILASDCVWFIFNQGECV